LCFGRLEITEHKPGGEVAVYENFRFHRATICGVCFQYNDYLVGIFWSGSNSRDYLVGTFWSGISGYYGN
jgi:hypothetical protein